MVSVEAKVGPARLYAPLLQLARIRMHITLNVYEVEK